MKKRMVLIPKNYDFKNIHKFDEIIDFYKGKVELFVITKKGKTNKTTNNNYQLFNYDDDYAKYLLMIAEFVFYGDDSITPTTKFFKPQILIKLTDDSNDEKVADFTIVEKERDKYDLFTKESTNIINGITNLTTVVGSLTLDITERKHRDITFGLWKLNNSGGIYTFAMNMAKYYREKYQARTFAIAELSAEAAKEEKAYFSSGFDCELADCDNKEELGIFLKYYDGYIISTQPVVQLFFQKYYQNKDVVVMLHIDTKNLAKGKMYEKLLGSINKMYNYKQLVVLSKLHEKDVRIRLKGKILKRITNINNSIDLPFTELPNENKTVSWAYIGRLRFEKNPLGLITLAQEIKKRNENILINVYGDGPLKEEFLEKIEKNNLADVIIYHGFESDKELIFRNNDGLLLVSESEGFPYVVLESYAFARPVVVFDTFTAARDIVEDNKTGYVIKSNNYELMLTKMLEVSKLKSVDFKEKHQKYSNDYIFEQWDNLFEKISKMSSLKKPRKKNKFLKKIKKRLKKYRKKLRKIFKES